MNTILVLYSEVMGYNLGCFRELVARGYEVHCVRWDQHKKTPYEPSNEKGITFYLRSQHTSIEILKLANIIKPKLILVSGWMDKEYLKVCKVYKNKIPVISKLDNWWKATLKQHIASALSFVLIKPYFTHLFVAGQKQYQYAKKLGYKSSHILTGVYTCNNLLFNHKKSKIENTKKIIFVGRFTKIKGILPFVKYFNEISSMIPEWSFELYGNGELKNEILKYSSKSIIVNDFIEPEQLTYKLKEASIFCLPSLHEPWGLVIHEAVCSSLPLLVSKNIGACSTFLVEGQNGFSFSADNEEDIKSKILKICQLTPTELNAFSECSYELSKLNSPQNWSNQLLNTLK